MLGPKQEDTDGMVRGLGLGRQGQDAPQDATIRGGASRRTPAHGPGGVPQSGEKSGAERARPDSFAVIYGTTPSDNAVQDTER
jgi:hypothetical protein